MYSIGLLLSERKMNLDRNVVAIDPGTRKLGWSKFVDKQLMTSGVYEVRKKDGKDDWMRRTDEMGQFCRTLTKGLAISNTVILIEEPMFFQGGSSRGSAAMESGSILKLMGLVMAIRTVFRIMQFTVVTIPVVKWKGQTPKEVTMRRMMGRYNRIFKDDNECDAVGIGDYFIRIGHKKLEPPRNASEWL